MKISISQDTSWNRAFNAARKTIGVPETDKEPTEEWKYKMLIAEHSPIKLVEYTIKFEGLRQWVGVHILRHLFVLPFIHSQREDRRKLECKRDELPQGEENDQDFVLNAQTLINISRKRLCRCASKETREAWESVKLVMETVDPVVAKCMVPNCVYRGFCPELKSCGYTTTENYRKAVIDYRTLTLE